MSSNPHIDELLAEFLGATAPELLKRLERVEGKVDACMVAVERSANDRLADRERLSRYIRRTRAIEKEVERISVQAEGTDWKVDPREVTGTFDLRQLKEEARARNSEHKWLRRKRLEWIVAALGGLAVIVISALVSVATTRAIASPPSSHQTK